MTFQLLRDLDVSSTAAFIDVGGGASNLVDQLLERGFCDVTVLDVSTEAIAVAQRRVGSDPRVTWLVDDLLEWRSERRYDVWHDRAVFHFLANGEIDVYRSLLQHTLAPEGVVILATFALDGPEFCSGLPVQRYGPDDLVGVLGADFALVTSRKEVHVTPGGTEQTFTWIAARRRKPGAPLIS
jgi:2-polyprenyl-3-methyl-5-hydroxy-6-metoxy-1,4-benzoquinol methylase